MDLFLFVLARIVHNPVLSQILVESTLIQQWKWTKFCCELLGEKNRFAMVYGWCRSNV